MIHVARVISDPEPKPVLGRETGFIRIFGSGYGEYYTDKTELNSTISFHKVFLLRMQWLDSGHFDWDGLILEANCHISRDLPMADANGISLANVHFITFMPLPELTMPKQGVR